MSEQTTGSTVTFDGAAYDVPPAVALELKRLWRLEGSIGEFIRQIEPPLRDMAAVVELAYKELPQNPESLKALKRLRAALAKLKEQGGGQ